MTDITSRMTSGNTFEQIIPRCFCQPSLGKENRHGCSSWQKRKTKLNRPARICNERAGMPVTVSCVLLHTPNLSVNQRNGDACREQQNRTTNIVVRHQADRRRDRSRDNRCRECLLCCTQHTITGMEMETKAVSLGVVFVQATVISDLLDKFLQVCIAAFAFALVRKNCILWMVLSSTSDLELLLFCDRKKHHPNASFDVLGSCKPSTHRSGC